MLINWLPMLLAGGAGLMAASAPGIVLAGVAVFWLMHRQQRVAMV